MPRKSKRSKERTIWTGDLTIYTEEPTQYSQDPNQYIEDPAVYPPVIATKLDTTILLATLPQATEFIFGKNGIKNWQQCRTLVVLSLLAAGWDGDINSICDADNCLLGHMVLRNVSCRSWALPLVPMRWGTHMMQYIQDYMGPEYSEDGNFVPWWLQLEQ